MSDKASAPFMLKVIEDLENLGLQGRWAIKKYKNINNKLVESGGEHADSYHLPPYWMIDHPCYRLHEV